MPYAVVHHFPGGTQAQYEATLASVHPGRETLPKGQIRHTAGPSENGWTIVAILESREIWEKFRDEVLMPHMKQGIEGGFKTPPQETAFEVYLALP